MHIYVGALRFGLVSVMLDDGFDAYLRGALRFDLVSVMPEDGFDAYLRGGP